MRCMKCGGETQTIDSRPDDITVRRRRKCKDCGHRFTTFEFAAEDFVEGGTDRSRTRHFGSVLRAVNAACARTAQGATP